MGENTRQNCTRQNKKKNPGRQQPCWGFLFCTNLTQPTGNLDTKTTAEIMDMVMGFARRFNQTIILVTHDPGMSKYADRIVTLVDGVITGDERKGQ